MRLSRDSYVSCSYLIELMLLLLDAPLIVLVPHDSNASLLTVLRVIYAIVRLNSRKFVSLLHSERIFGKSLGTDH